MPPKLFPEKSSTTMGLPILPVKKLSPHASVKVKNKSMDLKALIEERLREARLKPARKKEREVR